MQLQNMETVDDMPEKKRQIQILQASLKKDLKQFTSQPKGYLRKLIVFFTPSYLLERHYYSFLQRENQLLALWTECADFESIVKFYEEAQAITLSIPFKFFKTQEIFDLQMQILDLYIDAAQELCAQQILKGYENLFEIYVRSPQYDIYEKIMVTLVSILEQHQFSHNQEETEETSKNVFNSYLRLYQWCSPEDRLQYVWQRYIDYQSQRAAPNIKKLIEFRKENIKTINAEGVIAYLQQSDQRKVKEYINYLKFTKDDQYIIASKLLPLIHLRKVQDLKQYASKDQATSFIKLLLRELIKKMDVSEDYEKTIENHKRKIDYYKQNQWKQCLQYAYISLIKVYQRASLSKDSLSSEEQTQITNTYEELLEMKSYQKDKKDEMVKLWNEFVQKELMNVHPAYERILIIGDRYFEPGHEYGLILLLLKKCQRVNKLIRYWKTQEKKDMAAELEQFINMLKSNNFQLLQKEEKYLNQQEPSSLTTIKVRIIRQSKEEINCGKGSEKESNALIELS